MLKFQGVSSLFQRVEYGNMHLLSAHLGVSSFLHWAEYVSNHLLSFHRTRAMLVFSPIKVHDSREAPIDGIFASL